MIPSASIIVVCFLVTCPSARVTFLNFSSSSTTPFNLLVPQTVVVVAQERTTPKRSTRKRKVVIPEVCQHYDFPCITLIEMIANEGWKF